MMGSMGFDYMHELMLCYHEMNERTCLNLVIQVDIVEIVENVK
jgi:hypothetical protein